MSVTEIKSAKDFDALFGSNRSYEYVFVDFYAQWCGPCKRIAPKIQSMSASYKTIKFVKVDIEVAQELSEKYKITGMPTFMTFRSRLNSKGEKEEIYSRIVGANESEIKKRLEILNVNFS